jgi:uncharacterized membrane protein
MNQHTCLVCRLMDHTLVWRPTYKRVFNAACLGAITQAVQRCEAQTLVQVCVIAEQTLPYSYLRKQLPVRERAITLFGKHRVWDTERNCGILIYVNMVERAVEIVADRGISALIEQSQWDGWAQQLNQAFTHKQYQAGLIQTIHAMAPDLAKAMPGLNPINALADTPIVL